MELSSEREFLHEPSCNYLISLFVAVVFEVWELFPQDTLNSIHPFSSDIFILACNRNKLCLIGYYYKRCSCCCMCSFLILGDITEQITISFSILWISFYQILSALEILLAQLHVSFATGREAQYDIMGKAFDLGLRVFCLALVLPCCMILDVACHPCASLSFPDPHLPVKMPHCFGQELLSRCTYTYSDTASVCAKQAV